MAVTSSDLAKAQEKVLGSVQEPKSVNDEPVSGVQGAGPADKTYDQGNQTEQTADPGTEPVSGKSGKGIAEEPYDQGNKQPEEGEEELSIVDRLSRTKSTKKAPDRTMSIVDQLSRTKPPKTSVPQIETKSSQPNGTPTIIEQPASPVEKTEPRKMSIIDQLSRTKTKQERLASKQKKSQTVEDGEEEEEEEEKEERGRDETSTPTTASNSNNEKLKPRPRPVFERSVSPGELNDGTHVRCSGELGEAYRPPGKLMAKLHIGKH